MPNIDVMSQEKEAGRAMWDETQGDLHSSLLDSIFHLDNNRRIKPSVRKETSAEISEFSLPPVGGNVIQIKALAKSIERNADLSEKKLLNAVKVKKLVCSQKTLSKPLETHEAEKIRRTTGYSNVKQKVSRWDALVQANRKARCLTFPMDVEKVNSRKEESRILNLWKTQTPTPLEAEIYEILGSNKKEEDEEKDEKHIKLTLQELKERRKEIAKLRIQQSYQEAKARRQKRIKSKKYHRILRKEKIKKQLQDFELLQKTDPEAALKQLEQLERARAEERMTLRHKNTGQWARSRLVRAKYDPLTRQQLTEQLAVSRDLMKKPLTTDSGDEEHEAIPSVAKTPSDAGNPWIAAYSSSEVKEFVSGYRKYWEECNKKAGEESRVLKNDIALQGPKHIHVGANVDTRENMDLCCGEGNKETAIVGSKSKSSKMPVTTSENCWTSSQHIFGGKVSEVRKKLYPEKTHKLENEVNAEEKKKEGASSNIRNKPLQKAVWRNEQSLIDKSLSDACANYFGTSKGWVVTVPSQISNSLKTKQKENKKAKMLEQRERGGLATSEVLSLGNGKEDRYEVLTAFGEVENKLTCKAKTKLETLKTSLISESKSQKTNNTLKKVRFNTDSPLAFKSTASQINVDEELDEGPTRGIGSSGSQKVTPAFSANLTDLSSNGIEKANDRSEIGIDPADFVEVAPKLVLSAFADTELQNGETDEVEDEHHQRTVIEAFAGDDVIDDFKKEKEEVSRCRPKDIDLALPGWGSWAGSALDTNKRKKKRLFIKALYTPHRRDDNKVRVIINEEKAFKIPEHQVSEIPFSFSSVSDFEASIRAPVGSTWIPETAHKKLIQPGVVTKIGSVIKPLNEAFLMKKVV